MNCFVISPLHPPQLKEKLAQAVDLKFKIHLYHKVATALSPSLRSFLRKTVSGQEYEEVITTLAQLTEKAGAAEGVTLTLTLTLLNVYKMCSLT